MRVNLIFLLFIKDAGPPPTTSILSTTRASESLAALQTYIVRILNFICAIRTSSRVAPLLMNNRRRSTRNPLLPRWVVFLALTPSYTLAAPLAGEFIAGSGTITQAGTTTTITQSSQQASLNWQGFNIAPNEVVRFIQPSATAIAVNRIFDTNGSQLLGQLQANGQVWLINPNGVLFGAGSQVNVGALVASTLDISSLDGSTRNFSGSGKGSVVNLGSINAGTGGYVVLLANQVSNQGSIVAQLGTVALGAGSAATLSFNDNTLVRMQVDQSVLNSLAANGGLIRADGGLVLMSAGARDSLLASVVNNSGIIEARTVTEQTGGIILLGGMQAGSVKLSGTLDASALNGGNGGHIETSAAQVKIADTAHVTTAAANGIFGKWLIDPKDFTVASTGSDFNAAALSTALGSTSVELQSSQGAGAGSGNVNINAAVTWNANTSLTLTASNNVNVNANITATGNSAGVVINPNTANGGETASGTGYFNLHSGASITLSGTNPSLAIGGVNYTVINGLAALQNMNINTSGYYALGSNIDAADTVNWNGGRGFLPIGSTGTLFTGTLDGLGHSVNKLSIDQLTVGAVTANVGLIGSAGDGSVIQNIGVVDGNIKGGAGTGGLVGSNLTGSISNSYFTGTVTGGAGTGGLIGSTISGSIFKSYALGDVSGAAGSGGLVGSSTSGNISQSYHTGNVTGAAGTGGLVGSVTSGSIDNSYSIGSIAGQAGAGGLTGSVTSGTVSTSFAVGTVTGAAGTGALLGATSGPVVFSYWDNEIGPATSVGGGTGLTSAQMRDQSNFVGFDFNTIWGAFSGGLPSLKSLMTEVVVTANSVSKTYNGVAYAGGNGVSYSALPDGAIPTGLTFSGSSQGAVNASGTSYAITPGGLVSSQAVRYIFVDGSLTILPLAVNLSGSRAYDGSLNMLANAMTIGGLVGADTLSLSGVGTLTTKDAGSAKSMSIGTLAFGNGGTGLASNYFISGAAINANISQAAITLASNAVTKTYDGGLTAAGSAVVVSGSLMSGDSLSGGSFAFTDKNVGNGTKTVSTSGVTVGDGTHNSNYTVAYTNNTASTINAAAITLASNAVTKTYDGGLTASGSAVVVSGSLMSGDSLSGGSFAFTDKNVGNGTKTVSTSGVTVGDGTHNSNYTVAYTNNTASTINAAAITLASNAVTKTYDGGLTASGSAVVVSGSLMSGDSLSGGSFAFTDKNVGSANKTVSTSGVTVGDGTHNSNYTVAYANNTASTIRAANISVYDVSAGNKVSDGNAHATLGGTADVDSLGGDILTVGGTGVGQFADALVGNAKPVTVTGFTLIGTYAGNYNLVQPTGLIANITAAGTSITPTPPTITNPETQVLTSTIPALLVADQNPRTERPISLVSTTSNSVACDGAYSSNFLNGTNDSMGPSTSLTNCGVNLPVDVVRIR